MSTSDLTIDDSAVVAASAPPAPIITARGVVKRYATGRVDRDSAMGWEVFTRSMDRFTDFACFRSSELLLLAESQRLTIPEADKQESSR